MWQCDNGDVKTIACIYDIHWGNEFLRCKLIEYVGRSEYTTPSYEWIAENIYGNRQSVVLCEAHTFDTELLAEVLLEKLQREGVQGDA